MVGVTEHRDGCVLVVRAQPGAKKSRVVGEYAGALKIAVTAPAQDGRANQALVELLREVLGVKRVELVGGETNREKRFLIRNVNKEELEARLATLVAQ
jgi:hypothetical protein